MPSKYRCAVLGSTGLVGQRFVQILDSHPWFEAVVLAASEKSAGNTYGDVCRWQCENPMPKWAREMKVCTASLSAFREHGVDIVFSALPASEAVTIEPELAIRYPVFSKASAHRMQPDVPLIVPEVNPEQSRLISVQRKRRNWKGFLTADPNCTTTQLALALAPFRKYGLRCVNVVSMQALSGAGINGVGALETADNVIPYIKDEEKKVETETTKIFGRLTASRIIPANVSVSAACNRVNVSDGHMECVSVGLKKRVSLAKLKEDIAGFAGEPQCLKTPTAPEKPLILEDAENRPQPRLDRDAGRGMSVTLGRLRRDACLDWKFVCLGHNTIRGAAGNGILHAELFKAYGII